MPAVCPQFTPVGLVFLAFPLVPVGQYQNGLHVKIPRLLRRSNVYNLLPWKLNLEKFCLRDIMMACWRGQHSPTWIFLLPVMASFDSLLLLQVLVNSGWYSCLWIVFSYIFVTGVMPDNLFYHLANANPSLCLYKSFDPFNFMAKFVIA